MNIEAVILLGGVFIVLAIASFIERNEKISLILGSIGIFIIFLHVGQAPAKVFEIENNILNAVVEEIAEVNDFDDKLLALEIKEKISNLYKGEYNLEILNNERTKTIKINYKVYPKWNIYYVKSNTEYNLEI